MVLKELRTGLEKKFYDLCKDVVGKQGLSLYDLEFHPTRSLLRVYIINQETKNALLDDCVHIDRALTPFLDSEEWIPSELILEVSSPGVYRNLTEKEHFQQSTGEWISVVLLSKIADTDKDFQEKLHNLPQKYQGQKKLRGILREVGEDFVELDLGDCRLTIKHNAIKKASLDPEWP